MAVWDRFLTDRDQRVFPRSGYGRREGIGTRPAIVVIDVVTAFVGDRSEPILQSMDRWYNSCGSEGWAAMQQIERLLATARSVGIPVVYSQPVEPRADGFDAGRWADKNDRLAEDRLPQNSGGNDIPAGIAPRRHDIVVRSSKPSIFFGTLLLPYLIDLRVDSLVVTGTTTSGCVRATVVDAFSYNFRVNVVEECTFDRGEASHALSLFDMDQKYADVVSIDAACRYLEALSDDLYTDWIPALATSSSDRD